jgi:hypothetical protein
VVVVVLGAAAVDGLADLTQGRPEAPEEGTETIVVYDVATRRSDRAEDEAAKLLWALCSTLTSHRTVAGPDAVVDGWVVRIQPALPRQSRARVEGCLEDLTLERVLGHVVSIEVHHLDEPVS